LLVLFANLLMAREPVYGVGEWAALFPPHTPNLRLVVQKYRIL